MKILHEIKYRCSSVNRTSRLPGLGNWKRFLFLKYQLKFALFPTKINQYRCESFNKSTGNKRTLSWFRVEVNNRRQCYSYVRIWLADTDDSALRASDAFTVFGKKYNCCTMYRSQTHYFCVNETRVQYTHLTTWLQRSLLKLEQMRIGLF